MYFVLSPTKDMKAETLQVNKSIPALIHKSKKLMKQLQKLSVEEIMQTMKVNEKRAKLNYERFVHFAFDEHGQAAIDTYYGLQFKQLRLDAYDDEMNCYMNDHIRILSGLYGVLKPYDSIYPYRLEMQYKPFDLYRYWNKEINAYFKDEIVVNVASNEYGDILNGENVYQVVFKIRKNDKLVTQSTQAKMARGRFIDFVIQNKIDSLHEIKKFNEDGYCFMEVLSDEKTYVFVKKDN